MSAIRKVVDTFNEKGVSHVIHAGDLISPFTFEVFGELRSKFSAVFGNNDGDKLLLKQKSGGVICNQPLLLTLGGKRIVVVHEPDLVEALGDSGHFDLVVYGHTHMPDVRRIKQTLVVNPGKASKLHKGDSTIALLDPDQMKAEILRL